MTRILHILDHSIPLHSGYTFRTLSILREQRKLGWETTHLTTPKHVGCDLLEEDVDGWHFYRTPAATAGSLPLRPHRRPAGGRHRVGRRLHRRRRKAHIDRHR